MSSSTRPARVDSRHPSRLYTQTGTLAWGMIAKVVSAITTGIGVITFVVSLGVRYGELQVTVQNQTKTLESFERALKESRRDHKVQIDRLTYAIKKQNEQIVNLRIAVAASAAADEVRRGGTYDREEVLGPSRARTSSSRVPPHRQAEQARRDALNALDKAKSLDPLAGLEGL